MADTYLTWWTSIETDLRKSLVINAMRDHGAMHSLIRTAFESGQRSATPPSPSTAPEAWVYECKQPHTDPVIWAEFFSRDKPSDAPYIRNARPLYGAAIASRPAEVDDEEELPVPVARIYTQNGYRRASVQPGPGEPLFTAEQYRQGQRDAVAADRARMLHQVLDCYSPDDTAGDYQDKIRALMAAPSHTTKKENG